MKLQKTLPALLACLAILPAHADGVGRADKSALKQITVDLKTCDKPVWPPEALRRELTGTVTLSFLIGLDGKVLESRIDKSSGHDMLDLAAQDGLAKCQFTPPSSVGRTEPSWMKMQYVWTLEADKTPEQRKAEWEKDLALAAQGDAAAMYRVSSAYMMGRNGVDRNQEEARRLLRQSAEKGYVKAQEALAVMLMSGRLGPANPEEARMWTEKALAQGSASAQMGLGMMLLGGPPEQRDTARGRALLEKSVAQGHVMSMSILGDWLVREGGEPQTGLRLLEEAAAKQDRWAQMRLGEALEKGELLPQDKPRALALYKRAAAAGLAPASRAVERLNQEGVR